MHSKIQALRPPDSHHLQAAQGWVELGNYDEANDELEQIHPELRVHPDVLEIRYEIYAHAENWVACVDIAAAIIKLVPEQSSGWVRRSFALHVLKHTKEAYENLLCVAEKFPTVWTIPYNLACYCSQLGRFNEARDWFKKAMRIDENTVREAGIDDPDLLPLWDSMSGTMWMKE
jgi:tetratricopeptide (TPR) repeat protein